MSSQPIPIKTADGVAELSSRQRKLSQRHRTVLLLVDGRRSEAQVRQMAVQAGAAEACFDELVSLGLIALPQPVAEPVAADPPAQAAVFDAAPPSDEPAEPVAAGDIAVAAAAETTAAPDSVVSLLPPAQTLQPESTLMGDSTLGGLGSSSGLTPLTELEDILEEARGILLRAVRAEAPVSGSLTLLRLRRARSRDDLEALLDEVEARITKPNKGLWAAQTMERARELLHNHAVQSMPMPLA